MSVLVEPYLRITDESAVRSALLSPKVFAPTNALQAVTPLCRPALRVLQAAKFSLPPVLANVHGPHHRARRVALAKLFTSSVVQDMESLARQYVYQQVQVAQAQLADVGSVDLAATVAGPPPTELMLHLLQWRIADLGLLKSWSDAALELFWGWPCPDRQVELAKSCVALHQWLRDVVLGQSNAFAEAMRPAALSDQELLSLAFFLAIAGHQTTTYLASAALEWVLSDRAVWDGVEPSADGYRTWAGQWAQAVLAHKSSVHTWRRVAVQDTELAGATITAGTEVVLQLTGFEAMAIRQGQLPPAQSYQMAFGVGLHRCLGAGLAEMELRVILELTRAKLPHSVLSEDIVDVPRVELLSFQAPKSVLVTSTR